MDGPAALEENRCERVVEVVDVWHAGFANENAYNQRTLSGWRW